MNRNCNGPLVLFFVALLTSALFGGGPEPRIPVESADIADDSVTNAKLAEPISVANGGTGKTTAAEALAALGGASLNGSSTVDFSAQDILARSVSLGNTVQSASATGYINSWADDPSSPVKFKKTLDNTVVFQGITAGGTIGTVAFTLPVGYRPTQTIYITANSNGAFARVYITPEGYVVPDIGNTVGVSLTGMTFIVGE